MAQDVLEMCFTNIRIYAARIRPETKRNDKYPPCTVKPWWVGGVGSVSDFLLPSLAGRLRDLPQGSALTKSKRHKGSMHRKFSSGIRTKMLGRLYPANIAAQLKCVSVVGRVAVKQCNGSSWWEIPVVSTLTLMMASLPMN